MRILVADSLREFVEAESIPDDIEVEYFVGSELPAGDYVALMPDITRRVSRDHLASLPALRIIANYGAGYDAIDLEAARERGVQVTNTPGVLTSATAELTWALILAAARRVGEGERLLRAGEWKGWQPTHMRGLSLDGKVLGIVGAGRIGQAVGDKAAAFGMSVLYWSLKRAPEWESSTGARYLTLRDLLEQADVVTVHLPLTDQTRHLIGERELALMKRSAILVNTARGPIIDEEALIAALEARTIRAAALDVYEHEPAVPERLRALDNAVLLPHLGSATMEARLRMWQTAWRNLLAGVRGETPPNPVP